MPRSKTRIPSGTSSRLTDMIRATTKAVEANRDTINALNVFPVPDGDTGTNMLLTLRSIVEALPTNSTESANSVSKSVARSALLGARGNSGLILAQYFKGLAEAIGDDTELTGEHFARSIRIASDSAYKALPNPVEGTMLTVYRECADIAEQAAAKNEELVSVLAEVAQEAIYSVRSRGSRFRRFRVRCDARRCTASTKRRGASRPSSRSAHARRQELHGISESRLRRFFARDRMGLLHGVRHPG